MLGDDEDLAAKGIIIVVEDARGVEWHSVDASLKMQMDACRSARLPLKANRITRLKPLPLLYEIARMMAIECL